MFFSKGFNDFFPSKLAKSQMNSPWILFSLYIMHILKACSSWLLWYQTIKDCWTTEFSATESCLSCWIIFWSAPTETFTMIRLIWVRYWANFRFQLLKWYNSRLMYSVSLRLSYKATMISARNWQSWFRRFV